MTTPTVDCNVPAFDPQKPEADMRDIRDIHDLEEVKERISETLDDAWELPEAERKKVCVCVCVYLRVCVRVCAFVCMCVLAYLRDGCTFNIKYDMCTN